MNPSVVIMVDVGVVADEDVNGGNCVELFETVSGYN